MNSFPQPTGGSLLDTVKNTLRNNYLIVLGVILFIGIAVFVYMQFIAPQLKQAFKPNQERVIDDTGSNKKAEMMLFYVDWCPHCKSAKPEWEDMKREYDGKTINGYTVNFVDYDCTNETPEIESLMDTYKIEGYPTIKLLKDDQVIEFDAKPTKKTMEQFLNTVL